MPIAESFFFLTLRESSLVTRSGLIQLALSSFRGINETFFETYGFNASKWKHMTYVYKTTLWEDSANIMRFIFLRKGAFCVFQFEKKSAVIICTLKFGIFFSFCFSFHFYLSTCNVIYFLYFFIVASFYLRIWLVWKNIGD